MRTDQRKLPSFAVMKHAGLTGLLVALQLSTGAPTVYAAGTCTLTTVELPVHIIGGRAIATIGINGQEVRMLVDSGAWFSTLSNAAAAQLHLSPRYVPGFELHGIVGGSQARVVSADITLIKGKVPNVQFVVGGNELSGNVMGLLGRNILWHTDTEYDLARGVIRFAYPGDGCGNANMAYWAGTDPVSVLELDNRDSRPVAALVTEAKLNDMPVNVMFDTGAYSLVSIAAAKRAGVTESDLSSKGRLMGVGRGTSDFWTAPFERFEIGGEAISNNTLGVGDFELHDADMLLGMDFFLSHHIYASKKQSRMYFTYNGGAVFARNAEAAASPTAEGINDATLTGEGLGADALIRRGEALRARGDLAHALIDLDHACSVEPQNATCFDARAQVLADRNQVDKALADYDSALQLDPTLTHARLARAYLRTEQGDRIGAVADLDALDKAQAPQAQIRREMAPLYARLKEIDRAFAQFDLWIKTHPHDAGMASAYNARCWVLMVDGTALDRALADCNSALELDPDVPAHIDSRAWVWLRMGHLQQALLEFDRSLALKKDEASSLYGRGIIRLRLGDRSGGDADLAEARRADPRIDAKMKRQGLAFDELTPLLDDSRQRQN